MSWIEQGILVRCLNDACWGFLWPVYCEQPVWFRCDRHGAAGINMAMTDYRYGDLSAPGKITKMLARKMIQIGQSDN